MPAGLLTRRALVGRGARAGMLGAFALIAGDCSWTSNSPAPSAKGWRIPAEGVRHTRTWMSWPADGDIWGPALPGVQREIAEVARTISRYEEVVMIARPEQASRAGRLCGAGVEVLPMMNDDLWMRDIGPVFVVDRGGRLAGLDLNFNGWGGRQRHAHDSLVARRVLAHLGLPRVRAPFVSEGGAIETDGHGTALVTESSIVNSNRNPGKSRATLERELEETLSVDRVIWVPGLRGRDITDYHVDTLARFGRPGVVVVDRPADPRSTDVWSRAQRLAARLLSHARDARGRKLRVVGLPEPSAIRPGLDVNTFVATYLNWYVCNGGVIAPHFGDARADSCARSLLSELYPDRDVVQLNIDNVAQGGGGIHCATQQQPAV